MGSRWFCWSLWASFQSFWDRSALSYEWGIWSQTCSLNSQSSDIWFSQDVHQYSHLLLISLKWYFALWIRFEDHFSLCWVDAQNWSLDQQSPDINTQMYDFELSLWSDLWFAIQYRKSFLNQPWYWDLFQNWWLVELRVSSNSIIQLADLLWLEFILELVMYYERLWASIILFEF